MCLVLLRIGTVKLDRLKPNEALRGPVFPEPVQAIVVVPMGATVNRGVDPISDKRHSEAPKTAIEVRFIEVKGRAHTGEIALTANEYNTAKRLKKDYTYI